MKRRAAYLIINPRLGKNLERLADILAVLSAAGWKTDTALKEFGGHTKQLARKAANAGYDLVIGYGGDGTLNQVVNGVMASKRRRSTVGVIPGGTANVWAHEIGMTEDPVKAALHLINSAGRLVDLGHVEVDTHPHVTSAKVRASKERLSSGGRHHFLLMAGLGADAAILRSVNTSLKDKIGETAVALAAVKEVPSQHAFPIELRLLEAGKKPAVCWKGDALQVIVGNTRRYGNIAEVTPDARIDDGVLDVCVITAGDPLTTVEQILSIVLRREPIQGRSEYFQSAHVEIRVPASVELQLDGSRVKRKDALASPNRTAGTRADKPLADMVAYRFDAMSRVLKVAIPCTYAGALFGAETIANQDVERQEAAGITEGDASPEGADQIDELLQQGRRVTVRAVGPNPQRPGFHIVAGATSHGRTGESRPVAVRTDQDTAFISPTGVHLPATVAAALAEGEVIVVQGKQSKRGVIRAKRVLVGSEIAAS